MNINTNQIEKKLINSSELLFQTAEQLMAVFNTVNEAIVTIDKMGIILLVNNKMKSIFGYEENELIGSSLTMLMPEEYRSLHTEGMKRYLQSGEARVIGKRIEIFGQRKNGEIFPLDLSITKTETGENLCFTGAIRDLTQVNIAIKRIESLNKTILKFGSDSKVNIQYLLELCGKRTNAKFVIYDCLEEGSVKTLGNWNIPNNFKPVSKAKGQISYDLITNKSDEPLVIRNLEQSNYGKTNINITANNLKTYIGLKINNSGEYNNALGIYFNIDFEPDEEDMKFIGVIASCIEIEEKRLNVSKQLNKINNDLEILSSASEKIYSILSINEVLNHTLEVAIQFENVEMVGIYVLDKVQQNVVLKFHKNLPDTYIEKAYIIPESVGPTWEAILKRKPILIDSAENDSRIGSAGREFGKRSMLGIPIFANEKSFSTTKQNSKEPIGVIWFISHINQRYSAYDLSLLTAISVKVSNAILQAKFYEDEIIQRQNIEALEKITRSINSLNYSLVLRDITEHAQRLTNSKFAFVMVKANNGIFKTKAVYGEDEGYASKIHNEIDIDNNLPYECANFKKCIINKSPSLTSDIKNQFKIKYWRDALIQRKINSMVAIPLVYKGEVKGVLALYSSEYGFYRENELNLLIAFSNQAAIAIENARLYEESKNNSLRLIKLNDRIEKANVELKDFAHIVSHDLKAPLRGIGSLAEWIKEDYADKLDENGVESLGLLVSRVHRMSNLIDGILRYSRIGGINQQIVKVDLNRLIHELIDTIHLPSNIEISTEGTLPDIYCEKISIGQVLQNLIDNSLKFMDKPKGRISISCENDGKFWKFKVKDNGPGIEERHREKIFKIFQTLNPRDTIESTGIGLAIVKKIIDNYGGKIWIESELGKGCQFNFTIPKLKKPKTI